MKKRIPEVGMESFILEYIRVWKVWGRLRSVGTSLDMMLIVGVRFKR